MYILIWWIYHEIKHFILLCFYFNYIILINDACVYIVLKNFKVRRIYNFLNLNGFSCNFIIYFLIFRIFYLYILHIYKILFKNPFLKNFYLLNFIYKYLISIHMDITNQILTRRKCHVINDTYQSFFFSFFFFLKIPL